MFGQRKMAHGFPAKESMQDQELNNATNRQSTLGFV
jgi:hypothetical protein